MFRNRYTEESIFELPAYAKDYGLRVTHALASRCTPARSSTIQEGGDVEEGGDDVEMEDDTVDLSKKDDIYNGIRIPSLGSEARTTSPYRPTWYMYKTLMPYNSKDKRRAVFDPNASTADNTVRIEDGGGWMAWGYEGWTTTEDMNTVDAHWLFFTDTKNKGQKTGQPYLGDKFWCPGMVYTQDSNNLKIFRLAHILFDLAEAHMRMGNWDLANGYLNASRVRAGLDRLALNSEEEFMEELQKESARELFGEFTRRHNLVRWGIWYDQVVNHATYPTSSGTKESHCDIYSHVNPYPCREYYPIPDVQIVLSNYNLSNPEYDKYGL
jgi:hypothetical protein